jgi:hypothetical protein
VPGYICGQGRAGVRPGVRNGASRGSSKASQQRLSSGNCWNGTKVTNLGFTSLALHEKRGVNSSPAESNRLSHRAKPQRERLFFAVAADADTTSADVSGRANSGAFGGRCPQGAICRLLYGWLGLARRGATTRSHRLRYFDDS